MPNPPTPEELEGWETLANVSAYGFPVVTQAGSEAIHRLLAEVKRLREENAALRAEEEENIQLVREIRESIADLLPSDWRTPRTTPRL